MLFRHHLGLITVCISVSFIVKHEQPHLCSSGCTATSVLFSPMYCRQSLERCYYSRMSVNGRVSTPETPNVSRTNTNKATLHLEKRNHISWSARVGNDANRVQVRFALWMMRVVFSAIRLGPKTSECEKHVSVKSTVTGCDVTNCATTLQGFNMCRSFDSSNPPYPYPVTRIVTRRHCTISQVNSSP